MGRQTKGLIKCGKTWHFDKIINGRRVRGSTGTSDAKEAARFLAHYLEEVRQAEVYGVRPKRTFREAAIKYLKENQHKRSLRNDVQHIKLLDRYIGGLSLEYIGMSSLESLIQERKRQGRKTRTINYSLAVVRRICNLAAKPAKLGRAR